MAGGYEDWAKRRKQREQPKRGATAPKAAPAPAVPAKVKLTYKDQRDYELLPKRIEDLDKAIARDEAVLADPDLYAQGPAAFDRLMTAIDKARQEKDAAEMRWLELAEMAEGLG